MLSDVTATDQSDRNHAKADETQITQVIVNARARTELTGANQLISIHTRQIQRKTLSTIRQPVDHVQKAAQRHHDVTDGTNQFFRPLVHLGYATDDKRCAGGVKNVISPSQIKQAPILRQLIEAQRIENEGNHKVGDKASENFQ